MPTFKGWNVDQNNQFGADIGLNSHTFKVLPTGGVEVVATPQEKFFTGKEIDRMAEAAGPKSKEFWTEMQTAYSKQLPLWENSQDIGTSAIKAVAAKPEFKPVVAPTLTA